MSAYNDMIIHQKVKLSEPMLHRMFKTAYTDFKKLLYHTNVTLSKLGYFYKYGMPPTTFRELICYNSLLSLLKYMSAKLGSSIVLEYIDPDSMVYTCDSVGHCESAFFASELIIDANIKHHIQTINDLEIVSFVEEMN